MKNIICLDVTKFNNEKLADVANTLNLNYDVLLENKRNGFAKFFILNRKVIAYTTKKDKNKVEYTKHYSDLLLSLTPFSIEKEPKEMDVDTILDKISRYGIESLSINEKTFLDNQK
jgi:hypothetical protein